MSKENIDLNIVIKTTTLCPGKCACCSGRQKNFEYKNPTKLRFDIGLYKEICKNLKNMGGTYICLSGGEPTILPNLDEYIETSDRYGLATRINTMGWGISKEKMERWLSSGLDQVALSIYGTSKDIVSRTRGNTRIFEKTQDALSILGRIKSQQNFIFIVQTTIQQDNYRNLPEILEAAIDANADLFWPSYLEDANNLTKIRMMPEDIEYFRREIIPEMEEVVNRRLGSVSHRQDMIDAIRRLYAKNFPNYQYHDKDFQCSLLGSHFTFYPGGIVDPCPGHEYFSSEHQEIIDKDNIETFMSVGQLERNKRLNFEYCKHCPQGEHVGINLSGVQFHEHSDRESLE